MDKLIEDLIDEIGYNMDMQIDNCINYNDLRNSFKKILTKQCDMRIVSRSKREDTKISFEFVDKEYWDKNMCDCTGAKEMLTNEEKDYLSKIYREEE